MPFSFPPAFHPPLLLLSSCEWSKKCRWKSSQSWHADPPRRRIIIQSIWKGPMYLGLNFLQGWHRFRYLVNKCSLSPTLNSRWWALLQSACLFWLPLALFSASCMVAHMAFRIFIHSVNNTEDETPCGSSAWAQIQPLWPPPVVKSVLLCTKLLYATSAKGRSLAQLVCW